MNGELKFFIYVKKRGPVKGIDIKRSVLEIIENRRIMKNIGTKKSAMVKSFYNRYIIARAPKYLVDNMDYILKDINGKIIADILLPKEKKRSTATNDMSIVDYYYTDCNSLC